MYPDANVPVFQISMRSHYDPAEHFALGRALAPLRDEGVLIVGSGLSYHNLRNFGPQAKVPSAEFDKWLQAALDKPANERTPALLDWESAPYARLCHAQEDHLVPLFAALGAAEDEHATITYHDENVLGGVTASSWRFG
jgi:aromatic ring-opening dioxygenase catalytic subunit (LigB family)